jgi:hypothetical protein
VARGAAVAVAKAIEQARVLAHPGLEARRSLRGVDLAVLRLEVIGDAQQNVHRLIGTWRAAAARRQRVRNNPAIQPALSRLPRDDDNAHEHKQQRRREQDDNGISEHEVNLPRPGKIENRIGRMKPEEPWSDNRGSGVRQLFKDEAGRTLRRRGGDGTGGR